MKSMKTLLAAGCALALVTGTASAAIIVDGTAMWQNGGNPIVGNFDASGSDKVVVIVTGEHGFNQTGNGSSNGVTYDGVPMIELVNRAPIKADAGPPVVLVDDTFNAIYYLDNPAPGPGLISASVSSRGNVGVIALSGTAAGAGNTAIGNRDTNSADLTTSANSIVVGSYGLGGTGNHAQLAPVTTPGWDAEIARQENGNNWDGHVVAYDNNVGAGLATYTFDDTTTPQGDGRTGRHVILAEFTEVPEPGSLALMAIGGLLIARRRRA